MSSRTCLSTILLVGTTLLSSACAIGPELDIVVHESDRGAVYIERMPDRSLQAGSPNPLQPAETRAASSPTAVRLKPTESTKGTVYAYGRSLYVTLTEYHLQSERADANSKGSRRAVDPTGLATRTVDFMPTAAKRPESYRQARSTDATLVIDYELLTGLPAETTPPAAARPQPSRTPQTSPPTAESPTQKNSEIEALRKELEDIKRQLAEQASQHTRTQPKKAILQK